MDRRLELQALLEELLGCKHVYFQPPSSIRMQYPAIRYKRKTFNTTHANNRIYVSCPIYELILIGDKADGNLAAKILELPMCSHVSHYVSDNLNHDVFNLQF